MRMLLFLLVFSLSLPVMAGDMYVKSTKGKVLAGPGFKNKTVLVLNKGDKVEVLKTEGQWVKVSVGGKTGWMSKLLVSSKPPMGKVTLTAGEESEQQKANVRQRASGTSTAAAARGLREDERARLSDSEQENYQALQQVEQSQVDEKAVENFSKPLNK